MPDEQKKLLDFSIINFIKHSKAGGEKLHHNVNYEFILLAIQCNTNEGHFPISYFSFSQLKIERCVDPSSTAVGQWKRRGGNKTLGRLGNLPLASPPTPPKILMANGFMCEEKTCVFVFVCACACVGTQVEADCLHALRQSYSTQEKIQRMRKKLAFVSSAPPPHPHPLSLCFMPLRSKCAQRGFLLEHLACHAKPLRPDSPCFQFL